MVPAPAVDVTHFHAVDHTARPRFLSPVSRFEGPRHRCGLGDDAFGIAERLGPTGHVTGVDFSEALIAEATRRAANRNLPVTFEVGDGRTSVSPTKRSTWCARSAC